MLSTPQGSGFSGESLHFDLTHRVGGEQHVIPLIVRIQPEGYSLYEDHDLDAQWRVLDALHRHRDVPVPAIVAHDTSEGDWLGQPCFVMERVEGVVPGDQPQPPYSVSGWLLDASPAQQRQAYVSGLGAMAAIPRVEWRQLGLEFLLRSHVNPVGLGPQHDRDEHFLSALLTEHDLPLLERAVAWLRDHRPPDESLRLCWGDARLGNLLFREFRVAAVLDWEMVTLGSPVADLAWWIVFHDIRTTGIGRPNLPGFPDEVETKELYRQLASIDIDHLDFYLVRAALRAAMLLTRFTDAMRTAGRLRRDARRSPATPALDLLRRLLERVD